MSDKTTIGDRIRKVRMDLGMTQLAFAKKINVSRASIQTYEEGKSVPGGKVIAAIARLGVMTNWLLLGEGEIEQAATGAGDVPPIRRGRRSIVWVKLPVMFLVDLSADRGGELTTMDIIRREVASHVGDRCPADLEITDIQL